MRAHLENFALWYAPLIALVVLAQLPAYFRHVRVSGPERGLPPLLGRFRLPKLSASGVAGVGIVLAVSLLAATLAPVARGWWLLAAGVAALVYFPQVIDIPEVRRKPSSVPLILLLLGAAWNASPDRAEAAATWGILAIKLVIAQIYFSSGVMKLLQPGWRWTDGATLRAKLVHYHLRYDSAAALALAARPAWCRLAATVVLLFELGFWLIIPFPVLAWLFVPLGLAFHVGTAVTMRIHYWIYLAPAYLVFVRT